MTETRLNLPKNMWTVSASGERRPTRELMLALEEYGREEARQGFVRDTGRRVPSRDYPDLLLTVWEGLGVGNDRKRHEG